MDELLHLIEAIDQTCEAHDVCCACPLSIRDACAKGRFKNIIEELMNEVHESIKSELMVI